MKTAQQNVDSAAAAYLTAVSNRDDYSTKLETYLTNDNKVSKSWDTLQTMAEKMKNLNAANKQFKEGAAKTEENFTTEYAEAYNAYKAAYDVAALKDSTVTPESFKTETIGTATADKNSVLRTQLYGTNNAGTQDTCDLAVLNKLGENLTNYDEILITDRASSDEKGGDTKGTAATKGAANKKLFEKNVESEKKDYDTASDKLAKLTATQAGIKDYQAKYDAAVKAEADALTAKNNAAKAAVEASNNVTAAQNKYDTAVAEQLAVKDLDDADVAELQRFGKYNAYAYLSASGTSVSNKPGTATELTLLEETVRSAQGYVAATEKAKDAKDAAADEMHKASNILTRKKAAWRLGTPSVKVTSKKGAVKVSWKKVKHASKYKLRVKKGNGSYKTFKVKKGTKVKVKVRAQKGTKVSHYSGYKAARAK
jgi:hypothetical protein